MPQLGYPHPKQGKVRLRLNLQIRRLQKRLRRRRGNRSLSNPRNWQCRTHKEGVSKATKYTSHAVGEKRMLSTEEQQPKAKKMATTQTVQQFIPYASVATRMNSRKRINRKAKAGPVANASHGYRGTQNRSKTINLQMAPNDLSTAQSLIRLSPMGWIVVVEQMNVRIGRAATYKAARVIS